MPHIDGSHLAPYRRRLGYLRRFSEPTPNQAEEIRLLVELLEPFLDSEHVRFRTQEAHDAMVKAVRGEAA